MTAKYEITIIRDDEEMIYKTNSFEKMIDFVTEANNSGEYCKVYEPATGTYSVIVNDPDEQPDSDYVSMDMGAALALLAFSTLFE